MLKTFFVLLTCLCMLGCGDAEYGYEGDDMITGWSGTADLVSMNPEVRRTFQASFVNADGAGSLTVQFDVDDPLLTAVPLRFIAPTARITWSVEGNSVTRVVSVRNGMSITGVGEVIAIEIWDNAIPINPLIPPLPAQMTPYKVNITIGPGTRGPSNIAPTVIPYMSTVNLAGTALEGYGVSTVTNLGLASGNAIIDLSEYQGVTGIFFTISNAYLAITATDIAVAGSAVGGAVTFQGTGLNQNVWIPVPPSTSAITFYLNPADVASTYIVSATLSVDG